MTRQELDRVLEQSVAKALGVETATPPVKNSGPGRVAGSAARVLERA